MQSKSLADGLAEAGRTPGASCVAADIEQAGAAREESDGGRGRLLHWSIVIPNVAPPTVWTASIGVVTGEKLGEDMDIT